MKRKLCILLVLGAMSMMAYTQERPKEKIHQIFLKYIATRLALNPQEVGQMRILVSSYFDEVRAIHKNNTDPLIREQKKIALKIKYRNQIVPLLGEQKANQVFVEEQLFRKKIKEELRLRKALEEYN